jgi:hypothetical protein
MRNWRRRGSAGRIEFLVGQRAPTRRAVESQSDLWLNEGCGIQVHLYWLGDLTGHLVEV